MPHAVFNADQVDDLPKLEPATDGLLVAARVRTKAEGPNPKVLKYCLPELSGAGAVHTGLGPERIKWTIEAFVLDDDDHDYIVFRNKLRQYQATAATYTLRSEWGEEWPYCRLASFRPTAPPERCQSPELWCGWEVEFEWMQPGAEVAIRTD